MRGWDDDAVRGIAFLLYIIWRSFSIYIYIRKCSKSHAQREPQDFKSAQADCERERE